MRGENPIMFPIRLFPDKDNFEPKIKPGMLVLFPGTLEYLHGVKEVTQGVRYTIASFFTGSDHYLMDIPKLENA